MKVKGNSIILDNGVAAYTITKCRGGLKITKDDRLNTNDIKIQCFDNDTVLIK